MFVRVLGGVFCGSCGALPALFSYFGGRGGGVRAFGVSCLFLMSKRFHIIKNLLPELNFFHQEHVSSFPFSTSTPYKETSTSLRSRGRRPGLPSSACRAGGGQRGRWRCGRRSPCGESGCGAARAPGQRASGTGRGAFPQGAPAAGAQGRPGCGDPRGVETPDPRGRHGDASGLAGPRFLPVRRHYRPAGNSRGGTAPAELKGPKA